MPTITDIPKEKIVNLKDKTAIVYDNGLFIELAKTLSKSFKKIYYYMPWKNAFPKSNQYIVGEGVEGIERIHNFWDYLDEADIIIFPDIYNGDLQLHLSSIGKLVWGGRKGEEMEIHRDKMKEHMKSLGLYTTPFKVIKGIKALRDYLKENSNVYVKCNGLRGDFESFHSPNYKLVEPVIDELEYKLGAMKYIKEFVVEKAYDGAVESGVDMYTIDGQFPTKSLVGIEVKDLGFVGKVLPYDKIPKKVIDFNEKIKDTLKNYEYRGFMSTEVRIGKDKSPYMVDFCARQASPPGELYQLMYKNLAEIIWYGSQGYLIDPVVEHKFGVEALIHSTWADKNWQEIEFPKKYRDNIKLRNACIIEGKYYCVPQEVGLPEIGAVVAEADTLDDAIKIVKEIAEQVQGYYIEVKIDSIDKALEQFKELEKFGVKII